MGGEVQIKCAVEVITIVRDAIMVKPMQDSAEVTRKENDRVDQNEGEEYHEEESAVAEPRRIASKPHSSGKKPSQRIQAKKVKNVLRRKSQSKPNRTQVKPAACTFVRICLLGPAVEVTSQKSEEGEWRFLFGKPI